MADQFPARWYVGESQQDYGEPARFDGTVWEPPSLEEEQAAAASQGEYEAEPYLVAEHIRHEPYARLIAASPELYRLLKLAAGDPDGSKLLVGRALADARKVIADVEGRS